VSESADPPSARFGDIWTIASTLADLPPVPYLIVSSPAFHAAGLGVLACEVDMIEVRTSGITEPVPVLGTALLHTIGRYPAAWLREKVGEIESARHASVAARIRNLIGP
jgi:mRNA-degrading endonuclease toxin of MazEF toxin-antitoxin module